MVRGRETLRGSDETRFDSSQESSQSSEDSVWCEDDYTAPLLPNTSTPLTIAEGKVANNTSSRAGRNSTAQIRCVPQSHVF